MDVITQAVNELRHTAALIHASHTIEGKWADEEGKAEHDRLLSLADALSRQPQERGEVVAYLCDGMRFKVAATSSTRPVVGIAGLPAALAGRWVALVAADDDCHLAAASEPAAWKLRKDGRMWTTHIKRSMENYAGLGAEVTPLYAHPPADDARVAELEAQCSHLASVLAKRIGQLTASREREGRMREALEAFDKAAKESSSIIGFAGKAMGLITNARAELYRTENDAEWQPNTVYGDEPQDELMLVEVCYRNGRVESGTAASFFWNHTGSEDDIMQWRPDAALAAEKGEKE